jgi:hypothetical protein
LLAHVTAPALNHQEELTGNASEIKPRAIAVAHCIDAFERYLQLALPDMPPGHRKNGAASVAASLDAASLPRTFPALKR